jgi:hypothetical protein
MSRAQVDAMKHLGGNNQVFVVNQLIRLIENDMLDVENKNLMERLSVLKSLLRGIEVTA